MKVRGGHPIGLMQIPRNVKFVYVVQMAKNLVHSFYHILYQPKGVPTSSHNFSGSGGSHQFLLQVQCEKNSADNFEIFCGHLVTFDRKY
jgi:hypothetical protein